MADLTLNFPIPPDRPPREVFSMNVVTLREVIRLHRGVYLRALLSAKIQRQLWADKNLADPDVREAVENETTLAPLHEPFRLDHDVVFGEGPSLFIYGSRKCIMEMVDGRGLHVSGGVDHDQERQPKGVYATFITPYNHYISQDILSQFFFTDKRASPMTSELGHSDLDVSHFVMLNPTTKWTSSGFLQFRHPEAGVKVVDYWVLKSDAKVGSIVPYDIISYGKSDIPMSVEEKDVITFIPKKRGTYAMTESYLSKLE